MYHPLHITSKTVLEQLFLRTSFPFLSFLYWLGTSFLFFSYTVVLCDLTSAALAKAKAAINTTLLDAAKKGIITSARRALMMTKLTFSVKFERYQKSYSRITFHVMHGAVMSSRREALTNPCQWWWAYISDWLKTSQLRCVSRRLSRFNTAHCNMIINITLYDTILNILLAVYQNAM